MASQEHSQQPAFPTLAFGTLLSTEVLETAISTNRP